MPSNLYEASVISSDETLTKNNKVSGNSPYEQYETMQETLPSSSGLDKLMDYAGDSFEIIVAIGVFVFASLFWAVFRFIKRKIMKIKGKKKNAELLEVSKKQQEQREASQKHLQQQKQAIENARHIELARQKEALARQEQDIANHQEISLKEESDTLKRENVIEKVYSMDWSKDGATTSSMGQVSANTFYPKGVASIVYGADIQSEIASMLSSIIGMHKQGMTNQQIARALANAKLLNPNIKAEDLQELANVYLKLIEEMGISDEMSRYSKRNDRLKLSSSDNEVLNALNKGDISLLSETFTEATIFNAKKAEQLPEGFLKTELKHNASEYLRMVAILNLGGNANYAKEVALKALDFEPNNPKALNFMGSIALAKGNNDESYRYFEASATASESKKESSEYKVALRQMEEINKLQKMQEEDAMYALYTQNLKTAREQAKLYIQNFFANEDNEKKLMSII